MTVAHDIERLPWHEVDSSNVKRVAWVKERVNDFGEPLGSLFIEYHGGAPYRYSDVPEFRLRTLLEAKSVGSAVNKTIKGKFDFEQIIQFESPEEAQAGLLARIEALEADVANLNRAVKGMIRHGQ